MADLLISYARDGEAVADRLSTLLRQEGFSIWTEAAARGPIQDRVGDVRAAVVIWSDTSRVSEWIKAEANYARGQKKLVQASVDAEPPPLPFDAGTVVPLVDWSGDEGHPGWLRLRAELEGLCRKRTPPAVAAAAAVPERAAAAPPGAAPAAVPSRGGGGGLRTALAVLVALAVAGAAFLWMRSGPPYGSDDSPPASSQPERAPAAERPRPSPPVTAPPAPAPPFGEEQEGEILPGTQEPGTAPAEGTAPPVQQRPPAQVQQRPPAQVQQRPAQTRPASRPPSGRINRRNSRTMRQFCERAGRGTPQCREFQRQLRSQDR